MSRSVQAALVVSLGLILTVGCGGRDAGPQVDGSVDAPADTPPLPPDGAEPDIPPTPDEVVDDVGPDPGPIFEIGTNTTGANTPDSFSPLQSGDELNIELGFQGLWMVVLSFRTRDLFEGKVSIVTRIRVDGDQQGELGLAKQKLIPGGNGFDYYYNLFLVVMEPSVAGQTGEIWLTVFDEHGAEIDETFEVQLIGGTAD